jgi:hypothetical protein
VRGVRGVIRGTRYLNTSVFSRRGGEAAQALAGVFEHDDEIADQGPPRAALKALEKDPAARYATAREMADHLHRFLAGGAVHAEPAAYARLTAGKVRQHLSSACSSPPLACSSSANVDVGDSIPARFAPWEHDKGIRRRS